MSAWGKVDEEEMGGRMESLGVNDDGWGGGLWR